jgi:streptomycin 6-kinase
MGQSSDPMQGRGAHGSFALPKNLADDGLREDSPDLDDWIRALPGAVRDLTQRWSLRVGSPFQPGGTCAWVAPARDPAGRDLVLKVGWRHPEALHEADGLRLWNGEGAVRLYAATSFGSTCGLLLERCRPGTSLHRLAEPAQDEVVAGLLRRLWREPPPGHPFRSLQTMCDQWADEFEDKRARTGPVIDPGLARAGMELFRSLPGTASRQVVLCTDLHADNILAARREPWLAIDPKPYVGDPTYDPLQHMLNCPDRLAADPVGFANRLADLLELDARRLIEWLFARCVQESLDYPAHRDVAARIAPT